MVEPLLAFVTIPANTTTIAIATPIRVFKKNPAPIEIFLTPPGSHPGGVTKRTLTKRGQLDHSAISSATRSLWFGMADIEKLHPCVGSSVEFCSNIDAVVPHGVYWWSLVVLSQFPQNYNAAISINHCHHCLTLHLLHKSRIFKVFFSSSWLELSPPSNVIPEPLTAILSNSIALRVWTDAPAWHSMELRPTAVWLRLGVMSAASHAVIRTIATPEHPLQPALALLSPPSLLTSCKGNIQTYGTAELQSVTVSFQPCLLLGFYASNANLFLGNFEANFF